MKEISVKHGKKNTYTIFLTPTDNLLANKLSDSDRDRWREESGQPAWSVQEQNAGGEMKREGERRVSGEYKYRVETKHSV